MNPLLRSGIMGVVGFVLFALVWISFLVENFATPQEAVSLEIYRNELIHNPLFWWLAFASSAGLGSSLTSPLAATATMTKATERFALLNGILRPWGDL